MEEALLCLSPCQGVSQTTVRNVSKGQTRYLMSFKVRYGYGQEKDISFKSEKRCLTAIAECLFVESIAGSHNLPVALSKFRESCVHMTS